MLPCHENAHQGEFAHEFHLSYLEAEEESLLAAAEGAPPCPGAEEGTLLVAAAASRSWMAAEARL